MNKHIFFSRSALTKRTEFVSPYSSISTEGFYYNTPTVFLLLQHDNNKFLYCLHNTNAAKRRKGKSF